METTAVQCPTCFEWFEIPLPGAGELPAELDYDCEICCRPMVVSVGEEGALAKGLGD
ncbi:MAG: CPXCG motif-containing cysteine-rich protein [Verrucomicrobiota bacterium]